jgi:tetratricopeptide (TPR) repeat protein
MTTSTKNPLRDLVLEWPYAREFVLDTMDHDLIQRHGELLLSRSINIGRIVAFVGAGVSMSYGRISWRELVRELLESAEKEYRDGKFGEKHPRINIIYQTLQALKPTDNSDKDGAWREMPAARLLILFQIADELGEAIHRLKEENPGQQLNSVRKYARQLVYDDAGHARRLLGLACRGEQAREAAGEVAPVAAAKDDKSSDPLDWFDKHLEHRQLLRDLTSRQPQPPYHVIFERGNLTNISRDLPEGPLKKLCGKFVESRNQTSYLNPTHRFVVAAALAALEPEARDKYLEKPKPGLRRPFREETVDLERDPLQLLVNRLGVRRFITTNYDLDIERMMLDRGYRLSPNSGGEKPDKNLITESVNALEARARDFVFSKDGAAHLIDFAVQDGRFVLDLVHLHGRATDGTDIIATEADYQRLYLHDERGLGRGRDLIDGAINLAFRGNALLFVGNGMGEDDLLRPLRYFMSEGPSGRESDAIALLPDLKGEQARIEEKANLLRRYGVYTIHFGRGLFKSRDEESREDGKPRLGDKSNEPDKPREEFLLSGLVALIRFLVKRIGKLTDRQREVPKADYDVNRDKLSTAIQDELRKIESQGRDQPADPQGKPLSQRLVVVDTKTGKLVLNKISEIERPLVLNEIERQPLLIECELQTIDYLLDFCVRASLSLPEALEDDPELRAARILAENTEDAIVAGFLSATMSRLQGTWAEWSRQWFGDISPRAPMPRDEPMPHDSKWKGLPGILARGARIDRRRAITVPADRNSQRQPGSGGRFGIKTSQTLAQACAALSLHRDSRYRRATAMITKGRRVFVLAAPRGVGKGHFFSALTEDEGLARFLAASWPGSRPPARYVAAFAFNFSFSVELGSGFDRLTRFLRKRIHDLYGTKRVTNRGRETFAKRFSDRCDEFAGKTRDPQLRDEAVPHSGHRIGLLNFLFAVLAGKFKELPRPPGRFVLLFNATHLLFTGQGFAKSSDVTRLFGVLLNPAYSSAAVDVIFVTEDKGIPIEFRDRKLTSLPGGPGIPNPKETPPVQWSVEVVHSSKERLRSDTEEGAELTKLRLRRRGTGDAENVALFLRLRPAMLGVVAAAAFPRTLGAIVLNQRGHEEKINLQTLENEVADIFDKQTKNHRVVDRAGYVKAISTVGDVSASKKAQTSEVSKRTVAEINRRFGEYFKAFGKSRFALTLAFAAADEELLASENPAKAIQILDQIRTEVSGIDDPSREDSIVRAVIAIHRRRGVTQGPFRRILEETVASHYPEALDSASTQKQIRLFRCLSQLCEELLVALSMIGCPIERACLATLPFGALDTPLDASYANDEQRKAMVAAALEILVQRCLIFRFEPTMEAPSNSSERADIERFGVHRHVQRHVFRQLKQPFVEHAEIESYMPTLYASQPNDLPYPTITAQDRIRKIVAWLSRYPSSGRLSEWENSAEEPPHIQSRMLRAAYGTIRTVYGVGVVARFHEFGDKRTPPTVGYFEEHRQQVRWLLRRAKDVERLLEADARKSLKDYITSLRTEPVKPLKAGFKKKLQREADKKIDKRKELIDEKLSQDLPFYSGDIAWLYNECGVLSLVQGRLNDAGKLFSEALRALGPIERRGTPAALSASVRLNRALVDIELGNLRKAETALRDIIAQQDEHRAVRWIAIGYRGLIEHIRGNLDDAALRYQGAVTVLTRLKRNRAASIFSRHSADLHRRLKGKENLKKAEQLADNAVNLAAAGSHADVLHQARLSRLQIKAAVKGRESFAELRKELEGIETYAKMMGMPRLEVETAYVDAFFRYELGDLTMAMKSITRSLAIANDCDLVLRKIGGTLLAAKICVALGMHEGARTLAETAKVMATTAEFSMDQDTAQTILASL